MQVDIFMVPGWVLRKQPAFWGQQIVGKAQVGLLGVQKGHQVFTLGPHRRL